jgi:hypothetical protein
MNYLLSAVWIGAAATAATDVWALVRSRLFGIAAPNWGLVGRLIAHIPRGRPKHDSIAAAASVKGERLAGWLAHYLIGIAFAAALLAICGRGWIEDPTPVPPLLFGLATVLAPFLIMQPAMGAGIAASRTSRPNAARLQSLITHAVFGLGLFGAAWINPVTAAYGGYTPRTSTTVAIIMSVATPIHPGRWNN